MFEINIKGVIMKVYYKQSIYEKLVDEINKNSKIINYIEISTSEYIELLDCIHTKNKNILVDAELLNLVSGKNFNGIHLHVKEYK